MGGTQVVHAYPMHGYHKMRTEGFRTRDAHVIEWAAELLPGVVNVHSRPEPFPLRQLAFVRRKPKPVVGGTLDISTDVLRVPPVWNPKSWWVSSAALYPQMPLGKTIVWNPMLGLRKDIETLSGVGLHFDLLDDWLVHEAFKGIRPQVEKAYERLFQYASSISANSEATLERARTYGRDDAVLIPNGCDPDRFDRHSEATGTTTIGYLGKIGRRLDCDLIEKTAAAFRNWTFIFAGPVLERNYGDRIRAIPNVKMLGDVHYEKVPELLRSFDVGWVPHDVENGQVGGDAIKIYEYRAAGLEVVTTPIIGTRERPMAGVHIVDGHEQIAYFKGMGLNGKRVGRNLSPMPTDVTWKSKTTQILHQLGLL